MLSPGTRVVNALHVHAHSVQGSWHALAEPSLALQPSWPSRSPGFSVSRKSRECACIVAGIEQATLEDVAITYIHAMQAMQSHTSESERMESRQEGLRLACVSVSRSGDATESGPS